MHLLEAIERYAPELLAEAQPLALSLAELYFRDRYPGFDLEEPDWSDLRAKVEAVEKLLMTVKARLGPGPATG